MKNDNVKSYKKTVLIIIVIVAVLLVAAIVAAILLLPDHQNNDESSVLSTVSNDLQSDSSSGTSSAVSNEPVRPEKVTEVYTFKNVFNKPAVIRKVYEDPINHNKLPYCLFVPEDYSPSKKYPVILFLHGAGELGTDNNKQINNISKMFECNGDFIANAILLCPQTYEWWELYKATKGDNMGMLASAIHLLQEIQSTYSCDKNRIYVTGLSMGGFATWDLLEEHGNIFAAGVPICGGGSPHNAVKYLNIPIRIYHGTDDDTVSFRNSKQMYDAIRQAGGQKVTLIPLDGVKHNAWDPAYSDRDMFSWLFAQDKVANPSGEYRYVPYFEIKDSDGNTIISEEDIISCSYRRERNKEDSMIIDFKLTASGQNELKKAYTSSNGSPFTVYCAQQKVYSFTATEAPIDNIFAVADVFTVENYYEFYGTIEKIVK